MADNDVLASVFAEPITIRTATPDDVDWLIGQLKEFSKFNDTKYHVFGEEKEARAGLLGIMSQHFMRLAVRGDERLGFIGAWWVTHPYNSKIPLLAETFWWVDPAHRNGRAGLMLLDEFVAFAREHVKWATFSLLENSPVSDRVLTSRGFRKHETAYLLEID